MTKRVSLSGQRTVRLERVVHVGVDDGGVCGVGDNCRELGSSRKGGIQPVNGNGLLLTVDLDGVVLGVALEDGKGAIIRCL